jgi:hypothetical protein
VSAREAIERETDEPNARTNDVQCTWKRMR